MTDDAAAHTGHSITRRELEALVRRLVPDWQGVAIGRIAYLPGGYTNRNYRVEVAGRTYALRIVQHGVPRPGERRYLSTASAPEVVAYDPGRGHMLTRWIEGSCIDEAPPEPDEAGVYLAELHRQIPTGIRRYDFAAEVAAMLRRAQAGGLDDPEVTDHLRRLAWSPSRWCGCHNDLNPWNVIRDAGGSGGAARFRTLDWESAGDNDPLFDLVSLCVGLGWGLPKMSACLAAYQSCGGTVAATSARLRDTVTAFHIREYAWAVAQIAVGNDRDEIRAQADSMRETLADLRRNP